MNWFTETKADTTNTGRSQRGQTSYRVSFPVLVLGAWRVKAVNEKCLHAVVLRTKALCFQHFCFFLQTFVLCRWLRETTLSGFLQNLRQRGKRLCHQIHLTHIQAWRRRRTWRGSSDNHQKACVFNIHCSRVERQKPRLQTCCSNRKTIT